MSKFKYLTPKTIKEAISMYMEFSKESSMYISGGTDILLKIKNNEIFPKYLISLKHIKKHNNVVVNDQTGNLTIGGFVTHRELEVSSLIRKKYPIIRDAIKNIGSVQIRNVATIAGNIVNAVPSADGAIPLVALDGFVRLCGETGERIVELVNFFVGPGKTVIKPGEILLDIVIPKQELYTSGAYKKFSRRAAMELPIVGVAVLLTLEEETFLCKKARICLGVAAPTPMRAIQAEKFLEGNVIDEKLLTKAGEMSAIESKVRDSIRGKAWHRRELIAVYVKRMGMIAIDRIIKMKKATTN